MLLIHSHVSIRAAINLEAAGTTGPTLLFQATSEEMIQAYAKVPYPFGTIIAADIFKTGIMLSECVSTETVISAANNLFSTDFRQFVQYLDVSGLDVSIAHRVLSSLSDRLL
jgi:Zn-dependent M28 family amino/carboxypeptidase